jgi:hypothetical protein
LRTNPCLLLCAALFCCGLRAAARVFRRLEPSLFFGCDARLLKGV